MKTLSIRNVLAVAIVGVLLGTAYFTNPGLLKAPEAEAGTSENASGWAWSENIGWISFNSTNEASGASYGMNVDMTNKATGGAGDFSGNAWSRGASLDGGVGWISFDRAKTGNPPFAPFNGGSGPIAQVNWSTGKVTGWARALSACQSDLVDGLGNCTGSGAGSTAGGWDGWIKLSDDTVPTWAGHGVTISGNTFSGYAWGSDVVGWIDFAPTVGGVPLGVQISAPPCTVADVTASGTWGTCQALTQCVAPPVTQASVAGVRIGLCLSGGTVTQGCTILTQTCTVAPSGVKPKYQQF